MCNDTHRTVLALAVSPAGKKGAPVGAPFGDADCHGRKRPRNDAIVTIDVPKIA